MTEQQAHLSHPKYRPDIDGLRAIAVLAVVAFHAFPGWVKGGFIGVDVFFVISGYLISTIIYENLEKETFSFFEFYARRIRRIFPALILVLIACITFGWFALLADEYKQLGKHIAAGTGFVSNLVLWSEAGYFDNATETKPLLHLWSLGIEEQFYIIWPPLLWFAWKQNFNILTITIVVAIISFILNLNGVKQDMVATFYSPQSRFWELLSGSLLAWVTLYKKDALSNVKNIIDAWLSRIVYKKKQDCDGKVIANVLSFVGLSLLAYGFWKINKELKFPGNWALIPVVGAVLIITAGFKAWLNRTVLSNKITVWFGLISFPLYLWHWPLLSFARIIESDKPSWYIRIAAVTLSILLAWLTCNLIERPLRFGKYSKTKVTVLVVLMTIVGYVGYNIFRGDGYEFRSSIKGFVNNTNQLIDIPAIDEECLKYTGLKNPLFPYCRFTNANANANETVAIIGDSHALVAYPGIAEYLKSKGINTILLATAAWPPFMGSYIFRNDSEKNSFNDLIEQLLDTVSNHKDIRKVFIFTRGPYYNTGTEPLTGDKDANGGNIIPITELANSAQLTFNRLSNAGKLIFYITENPELYYSAKSCIIRPFKSTIINCSVDKTAVLKRQADYLNAFNNLKNVTIIDSLSAFCPQNNCIVFDENGSLLYADDDHLSIAGSNFQVNKLLKRFLE